MSPKDISKKTKAMEILPMWLWLHFMERINGVNKFNYTPHPFNQDKAEYTFSSFEK